EILALFGLNIADLGKERGLVTLPQTHLSRLPLVQSEPMIATSPKSPIRLPLEQTNLVHRMFQGLGEMPVFLLQQAGPQALLYGYVGSDDYTLDPIIRPGAFVQIDPQQNRVTKDMWPSEYDRPVYFVELRDNRYACSWCEYEGSRLLLVPSPMSPVRIRSVRYPQDAEIVGRVTGIAMLIAELRTDASATPSQS